MTGKQQKVLEAIKHYEEVHGRFPRQCDLIRHIENNDYNIRSDRRNISQFIDKLVEQGLIEKVAEKIVTKKVKTVIRIKVL